MPDRKYITMSEFQGEGFLLEANRQFFHPHGLALEICRVSAEEGATPVHALALRDDTYGELCALLTNAGASDELIEAVHGATRYEVGEGYISGVWDCRDDPEGVIMGGGLTDHERDKVKRVFAERERHRSAREAMFGTSQVEVDVCPTCEWAKGSDGPTPTTCPFHDTRTDRLPAGQADVQPVDWIPEEDIGA